MTAESDKSIQNNEPQAKPGLHKSTKGFLIAMAVSVVACTIAVPLMLHDMQAIAVGAIVGLLVGFLLGFIVRENLRDQQPADVPPSETNAEAPGTPSTDLTETPSPSLPLSYSLLATILVINQIGLLLLAARLGMTGFKEFLRGALSSEETMAFLLVLGLLGLVMLARKMITEDRGVPLWSAILGIGGALDLTHRLYSRAVGSFQPDTPGYIDIIGGGLDLLTLCAGIAAFWTSTLIIRRGINSQTPDK